MQRCLHVVLALQVVIRAHRVVLALQAVIRAHRAARPRLVAVAHQVLGFHIALLMRLVGLCLQETLLHLVWLAQVEATE